MLKIEAEILTIQEDSQESAEFL